MYGKEFTFSDPTPVNRASITIVFSCCYRQKTMCCRGNRMTFFVSCQANVEMRCLEFGRGTRSLTCEDAQRG